MTKFGILRPDLLYGYYIDAKKYIRKPIHGPKFDNRTKMHRGGRTKAKICLFF